MNGNDINQDWGREDGEMIRGVAGGQRGGDMELCSFRWVILYEIDMV